ncbi:secretion protein HlyD family protein [Dickeya chrysanthemi Ech1591]|uniref:Secretion protein HlyD family protein n=1 Tax=Dickeya chrysanthemi (strain Ech1591) TaxID=561229 RepID=C6CL62_DICC1|nr:HlyD family efflux transporter periplasmic adaptor subunit [Dickeya chrysanthemi]ACT07310.1 secretion protein HlyD family protein [Dickeya chrysanthemi Ech1591]WJM86787.1 HlyD family efflux transporter periplasmic adaptor subunit [Dickeya chrysanthemi]
MIGNIRWRRRVLYGGVIILAAVSAFLSRPTKTESETGTQWRAVTPSPVENHITLLAHVQAAEQYVVSAPFDSHISQLNVQDGQEVHKGDPLLALDTTPLQIEYRDGQAQFLKARQSLRNLRAWENSNEVMSAQRALIMAEMSERDAVSQLNAAQPLYRQGIIARSERDSLVQQLANRRLELQAARQALTSARASGSAENQTVAELELNNAEQKLQQIRDQQAHGWLYAPGDGYAVRIQNDDKDKIAFPRLGQRVGAGEALFMLAGVTRFDARAKADEADIDHLRPGMPVTLTSEALPGQPLAGTLRMVSPQANYAEGQPGATYDVVFNLDCCRAGQAVPRFGMSALITITLVSDPKGMVLLPDEIGQDEQGKTAVYYRPTPQSAPEVRRIDVVSPLPQGVLVKGLEPGEVRKWECCHAAAR